MAAEMADSSATLREELQRVLKEMQCRLQGALSKMRDRKVLKPSADPAELAQFTVAAVQGGMLLSKTLKEIAPLRQVLDHSLKYLKSHARAR